MSKEREEVRKMERRGHLTVKRLQRIIRRKVKDPRRSEYGNLLHNMVDMLIIVLLALICGCETWDEIHDYGEDKQEWLQTFLGLPNGIPSVSTLRRMLCAIKPKALESVYRQWVRPYVGSCIHKHISFDGKTVRGVKRGGDDPLHIVSAWVREDGISLGQIKVKGKSNEITAIPRLIEELELTGSVVTIDAMGCQQAIAKSIIENEANYMLAVKGNQPTLHEDIVEYFAWAQRDTIEQRQVQVYETEEYTHGRKTTWKVSVSTDTAWFVPGKEWTSLRSFVMVERTRNVKGQKSSEKAYYITSLEPSAKETFAYTRGHWSIENQLHWILDVSFREDHCRIHEGNAPQNLSLLRKIAYTCLKNDKTLSLSIARRQKKAARTNDYALSLIS